MPSQITPPLVGIGIGVVEQAPPHSIAVFIFLPVPARPQPRVGIGGPIACDARASPPFERKRFHQLNTVAATETERPRIRSAGCRIAPQQQPLAARPNPMD